MNEKKPLLLFSSFFVLPLSLAFGQDPPTPPGGFQVDEKTGITVTLSDGFKTKADLFYPKHSPGPKGWPLVVVVHGLGSGRSSVASLLKDLASIGYASIGYDVRGQGEAKKLSPGYGTQLIALDEIIDLAEIIEWAPKAFPGLVDGARVGVTGGSQGGLHSWAAAAMSGKAFPRNKRRTRPFPVVKAVVPFGFPPDKLNAALPLRKTCNPLFLRYICGHPNFILDPYIKSRVAPLLLSEKYDQAYNMIKSMPLSSFMKELETARTPVLAVLSWFDIWEDPSSAIDLMNAVPKSTAFRLYLQGMGHALIFNKRQGQRAVLMTGEWFNRFLKNKDNGIEKEAKVLSAVPPPDNLQAGNPLGIWMPREDRDFPPGGVRDRVYYLQEKGRLGKSFPTKNYSTVSIKHRVPPGYTVKEFVAIANDMLKILLKFPLSKALWTSPPLEEWIEIAGFPRVEFHLVPSARRFQLHAALTLISPKGREETISSGVFAEQVPKAGKMVHGKCRMSPIDSLVPKGWRLRLSLENLSFHKFPQGPGHLRTVPFMQSYDLNIYFGKQFQSKLCLPIRKTVPVAFESWDSMGYIAKKNAIRFFISGIPDMAGCPYVVLCGLSGQVPMTGLPGGGTLPLHLDGSTPLFLRIANTPGFPGFIGSLDSRGEAFPSIILKNLPLTASMAGTRLTAAAIVVRGAGLFPSTAVDTYFEP